MNDDELKRWMWQQLKRNWWVVQFYVSWFLFMITLFTILVVLLNRCATIWACPGLH